MIFFFLEYGGLRYVPRHAYALLVGGRARMPEYARQTVRIADWYVAGSQDALRVLNETYSVLYFDDLGRARAADVDYSWRPAVSERRALRRMLRASFKTTGGSSRRSGRSPAREAR